MAFTTIDDPSKYFQITLYTGNASSRSITNGGNSDMQPDWVWLKKRNEAQNHTVYDSNRGVGKILFPDGTDAEASSPSVVTAFDSDGFSLTADALGNDNTDTYLSWQWKANGGTTSSLSGGDIGITTTSQANTTALFSINTYTGTGSQSAIGHGLGVKPDFILIKNRDQADSWFAWHNRLNNNQALELDTDVAVLTNNAYMGNEAPTTTTIGLGTGHDTNASSEKYVCYAFAEVQGYSKFGSYTGNSNANGPFQFLGFKPAWLMIKPSTAQSSWFIVDNKRDVENPANKYLQANSNAVEATSDDKDIDFYANGFKARANTGWFNDNGETYLYVAFAESPLVGSDGTPTTAF